MEPLSAPLGEERPHSPQKRVQYIWLRAVCHKPDRADRDRAPTPALRLLPAVRRRATRRRGEL